MRDNTASPNACAVVFSPAYLYASFRFPAIRFDAPTFKGYRHARAKCPPVVLNALLGIARQWGREKFAVLFQKPRNHAIMLEL